jgi:hypothetical protein
MKRIFLITFVLVFCSTARAQTTYPATACTQAAISLAITNELATPVDGDIITIPAQTCTWTTGQSLAATFTHSVTIQGAGAISATTGGASTTGTDLTIIIDNTGAPVGSMMSFNIPTGKSFRFTGISLQGNGSTTAESGGILTLGGQSTAVRIDHNHFFVPGTLSQGLNVGGAIQGVADHNYFNSNPSDLTNDIGCRNGVNWNNDPNGIGSNSWADTEHWGSSQFFFIEDSRFFDGDELEFDNSGRCVFRYNTMNSTVTSPGSALQVYWHGQQTDVKRGGRAAEFYGNTFNSSENGGANSNPAISLNSGTALVWGNALIGAYKSLVQIAYNFRNQAGGGGLYSYPPPPAGWGFCGSAAGGPTNWDANHSSTSGYSCLGQPGRGKGDLLSGNSFATLVNSTTGTVAWPHEALSPIYVWNNTYNSLHYGSAALTGNGCAGSSVSLCTENTEYYQQFGNQGNTGTFNGTVGIGQGTLLPTNSSAYTNAPNCTGGTDPVTSAAAPGVGYFDTTNQTLYICNPTNTWTAYYTPYTYPHPLTGVSAATPTLNPGAGTYSGSQTVTISSTSGTLICWNTTGSPVTSGNGTTCSTGTGFTTNSGTNCVASSTVCGNITVSTSETVYAVAGSATLTDSLLASAAYVINSTPPASTPAMFAGSYRASGSASAAGRN